MKKIIVIGVSLLVIAAVVFRLSSNYKKVNANKNALVRKFDVANGELGHGVCLP